MTQENRADTELSRSLAALRRDLSELEERLRLREEPGGASGRLEAALLLSVRDLADLTGFSPHTIRDWCEQGLLPAQKIGNRWRIERRSAIMALKNLNRRRRRKRHGKDPS